MSSSHHDDHHLNEKKPVAFTVPLILASVLVLIIVLFLSLCDPKPHHGHEAGHGEADHVEATHHEATHHDAATHEDHTATSEVAPAEHKDSASVETTEPAAEPAHH